VIEDRQGAVVPHPRLHQRAFVLLPMRELAPDWVHPVLKTSIGELVSALAGDQEIRPVT
jgi:2-amino-4-hydroxy-6-hydroxymethyldihydropteridine diphosphokinase